MAATRLDSQVTILKTNAAVEKGLRTTADKTEVIWPKPQFVSRGSPSLVSRNHAPSMMRTMLMVSRAHQRRSTTSRTRKRPRASWFPLEPCLL
jgi:hypothetical protein